VHIVKRYPLIAAIVLSHFVIYALWFFDRSAAQFLLAKESVIEHVSHIILLGAIACWIHAASRRKGELKIVFVYAVTIYSFILLMEEINWGGVYGLTFFSNHISELTGGRGNLHSITLDKKITFLGDSYQWFQIPIVAFIASLFASLFIPRLKKMNLFFRRHGFGMEEFLGLVLLYVLSVPFEMNDPEHIKNSYLQELTETLFYLVIFYAGLKVSGGCSPQVKQRGQLS